MNSEGQPVICVATAGDPGERGTTIRALMDRLPCRTVELQGRWLELDSAARPISPLPLPGRGLRALERVTGLPIGRRLGRWAQGRFLTRNGVRAVLAQFAVTGAIIHRACRATGIPLIVHCRGFDVYRQPILDRCDAAYRKVFPSCAAVIVVSPDMASRVVQWGADARYVRCIPSGADCALFRPTDPGANPPRFVAAGRFVEKKAPHLTLLAFRRVLDACPDARLLMIGDGPLLPACRDIVAALGMAEAVELAGNRPHDEVARAMARARAFVQHSVTAADGDSEGTPVSVMEAGAAGLPVVATRHKGIPDVVLEGETGHLVAERDVEGMARSMLSLARDPALARRLGRAARARVERSFSLDAAVRRIWETIVEAAERT